MMAWRREPYPYSHSVEKTRKEHKCERCGGIISKGKRANYKNLFTGKRGYVHESRLTCSEITEHRLARVTEEPKWYK